MAKLETRKRALILLHDILGYTWRSCLLLIERQRLTLV